MNHSGLFALALATAAFCAPTPTLAQVSATEEIRAYVESASNTGDFHGSILVADSDRVLFQQSGGYANYEAAVPNTLSTKFRIGSVTKQFTAVLVLQEMQRGSIKLTDTISKYLPYYRKDIGNQITISQLLNHASGLPDLVPDFAEKYERYPYERQTFVEMFCSGDLKFAPGSKFSYSNSGYYILGAILETVTSQPYGDLLRRRIFEPVRMNDSMYVEDGTIIKNVASGYSRKKGAPGEYLNASYIDPSVPFAMGGIYSTVGDLYKWDRALYTSLLLSDETKTIMYTPLEGGTYSNGWINYRVDVPDQNRSLAMTMHEGSINGYSGAIFRNLENRYLVVILNNLGSNGSEWRIGEDLMKILARR